MKMNTPSTLGRKQTLKETPSASCLGDKLPTAGPGLSSLWRLPPVPPPLPPPTIYQRVLCSCVLSSPPSMLLTPLPLQSRSIFSLYLCTVTFWLSRKGAQTALMNSVQVSPHGCSVWVEHCYEAGRTLHLPSWTWVQRSCLGEKY